jgi:hypothetical protein
MGGWRKNDFYLFFLLGLFTFLQEAPKARLASYKAWALELPTMPYTINLVPLAASFCIGLEDRNHKTYFNISIYLASNFHFKLVIKCIQKQNLSTGFVQDWDRLLWETATFLNVVVSRTFGL